MKRAFEIHFLKTTNGYELSETRFTSFNSAERRCVRGKTSGAFKGAGSFQWTSAVRAISALFLRHIISQTISTIDGSISGVQASPAASFDYALSKGPLWLSDMFGVFETGQMKARRFFLVTNPNQKRPGPVTVAINEAAIAPGDVRVMTDGREVLNVQVLLSILQNIEHQDADPQLNLPKNTTIEATV